MNIKLAQIRYRNANFEYNYKNIIKNFDDKSDLMIYPDFEANTSMNFDSNYQKQKEEFFAKLCKDFSKNTVLIGKILIKEGKKYDLTDGFFDCFGKKVYVSKEYKDNIKCDLYVLVKNSYYAMKSHKEFIENTVTSTDFIYANSIMLNDEEVYAGQSFAKNSKNELVLDLPLLEEKVVEVDFSNKINRKEMVQEEEIQHLLQLLQQKL